MTVNNFRIGERRIGMGFPAYIVAELSGNHNRSLDRALELIHAAAEAGVDAIKLQTYTPDTITLNSDKPDFLIRGTVWNGRRLYELYREAFTPWEWHTRLKKEAEKLGLGFFSTAFDATAVDFLDELGVQVHKIASFELVDIPLIRKMARTGKPVILSTGMAADAEIQEAVAAVRGEGNVQILLLKCTSAYPAELADMNLRTIPDMQRRFEVPVGLSDHSLGDVASVVAVSLGACMVEKHLTMSRGEAGPDSGFSLEPAEFASLVRRVRETEAVLGGVVYGGAGLESEARNFRRSLYIAADMKRGEEFTHLNVRSVRPGFGLHPRWLPAVLGRRAARAAEKGTPLSWDLVEGGQL